MNRQEFLKTLNDFGWQAVKKAIKNMKVKGQCVIKLKKRKFKHIDIPSLNN